MKIVEWATQISTTALEKIHKAYTHHKQINKLEFNDIIVQDVQKNHS